MKARRLILGGVFTIDHFLLALEAVKIMQKEWKPLPRNEDGLSVLKELSFTKTDGSEVRFLCGFEKDDAVIYYDKEWMASKEYGIKT